MTLEGDGAIYDFALPDMLEIVRYRVGDAIEFGYAKPSDDGASTRQVVSLGGVRAKAEEAPAPDAEAESAGEAAQG